MPPPSSDRPTTLSTDPLQIRELLLSSLQSLQDPDCRLVRHLKDLRFSQSDATLIATEFGRSVRLELSEASHLESWERIWDVQSLQADFRGSEEDARGCSWNTAIQICIMHRLLEWAPKQLASRLAGASASSLTDDSMPLDLRRSTLVPTEALQRLSRIAAATDLRYPADRAPASAARAYKRKIHLHVGPTNSGKTYNALKELVKASQGVYAGPLRLLAHEVWSRINRGEIAGMDGVGRPCNLETGEEVRFVGSAGLSAATIEMTAQKSTPLDVAVFDEIQLIADGDRGGAWTQAVLGSCAREVHLCGEASSVDLIRRLAKEMGDDFDVTHYRRLSELSIADEPLPSLKDIQPGDCVVVLSRQRIHDQKAAIEAATGLKCAIAYGALPPETRAEQAALFNDPDSGYDVMVASDAVGMGLNL